MEIATITIALLLAVLHFVLVPEDEWSAASLWTRAQLGAGSLLIIIAAVAVIKGRSFASPLERQLHQHYENERTRLVTAHDSRVKALEHQIQQLDRRIAFQTRDLQSARSSNAQKDEQLEILERDRRSLIRQRRHAGTAALDDATVTKAFNIQVQFDSVCRLLVAEGFEVSSLRSFSAAIKELCGRKPASSLGAERRGAGGMCARESAGEDRRADVEKAMKEKEEAVAALKAAEARMEEMKASFWAQVEEKATAEAAEKVAAAEARADAMKASFYTELEQRLAQQVDARVTERQQQLDIEANELRVKLSADLDRQVAAQVTSQTGHQTLALSQAKAEHQRSLLELQERLRGTDASVQLQAAQITNLTAALQQKAADHTAAAVAANNAAAATAQQHAAQVQDLRGRLQVATSEKQLLEVDKFELQLDLDVAVLERDDMVVEHAKAISELTTALQDRDETIGDLAAQVDDLGAQLNELQDGGGGFTTPPYLGGFSPLAEEMEETEDGGGVVMSGTGESGAAGFDFSGGF